MAVRGNIVGNRQSGKALEKATAVGLITSPTKVCRDRRPTSRSRSASRCCWRARRASARPRAAKAIAAVLGRRLIRLQCYEGIDASGGAL